MKQTSQDPRKNRRPLPQIQTRGAPAFPLPFVRKTGLGTCQQCCHLSADLALLRSSRQVVQVVRVGQSVVQLLEPVVPAEVPPLGRHEPIHVAGEDGNVAAPVTTVTGDERLQRATVEGIH